MQVILPFVLIYILFFGAVDAHAQEAILTIEDGCAGAGEQDKILLTLDNSTIGEVWAGEITLKFNKNVFTVTDVNKADRSQDIELFQYSEHVEGITFIFTGIDHSISAGTGAIADIVFSVNAGASNESYNWILSEVNLSTRQGIQFSVTTEDGTFQVPCPSSPSRTIRVPNDMPTIQLGLNYATEGDTILVASGIYYENLSWPIINESALKTGYIFSLDKETSSRA